MNPIPKRVAVLIWSSLILLAVPSRGALITATYNSAGTVPLTVASYTAPGNTVDFSLNFAPPAGTNLMVVKNTGSARIQGVLDNLAQGQLVNLAYGGVTYPFVANYYGGTGNDLVLQWATTRLLAWGGNANGELGNNDTASSTLPVAVDPGGVLSGRTVIAAAAGGSHNLVACADGTLAAWGDNAYGQLGNGSTTDSRVPVLVNRTGVLAGRTVVAISAGNAHNLALCSDGTLAAWGSNDSGRLGNNSATNSSVPVAVDLTGVLAGKVVTAVAAGGSHNVVLCADGTVAAWGGNSNGQLGNNTTTSSLAPVAVDRSGVLAGRTVVGVAAGGNQGFAVCGDGAVAAWGGNYNGQLGIGGTTDSKVPVLVDRSGALSGKAVVALAAGTDHCLALCADGIMASWGYNTQGQAGNGSVLRSEVPKFVNVTGLIAAKIITSMSAGGSHSFVLCADGTLAAWGYNASGQLGNHSTVSSGTPVLVDTSALGTGARFLAVTAGTAHSLALVGSPLPPVATTLAATGITDTGATLNGSVNAQATPADVAFEYGLTSSYGTTVAAVPASASGTTDTAASATLGGLLAGTTYHYRIVATRGGAVPGEDRVFATSDFTLLSGLTLSSGALVPGFSGNTASYTTAVPYAVSSITVTPVLASATSRVKVNGVSVISGTASGPLNLTVGNTVISVVVTAADSGATKTYTLTVTRQPMVYTYASAATVPVTASSFVASGNMATFALTYAPTPGTILMVVKNTGGAFIQGTFDNLAQGQLVNLTYGGVTYPFVANYFGGTGNDLVLQWANTRLLSWGSNGYGQLGNGGAASGTPSAVDGSGALAGKVLLAVTGGGSHSFALCSDGTVAGWGAYNQIGLGSSNNEARPVAVASGELANRTVVAVDAGGSHTLALCADGALVAWGSNSYGQLGKSNTYNTPVLVDRSGVLAGKTITQIAAGGYHSLVLCSDGTLAAWGYSGRLGNGLAAQSSVPVLVTQTGVLTGKTVVAIAAGGTHSLALCADGTLAAWGGNASGQLGNNSATNALVPVLVTRTGVLSGKTITAIAAGGSHSLVLCSDGVVVAWGENGDGQLGDGTGTTDQWLPVLVNRSGVLAGKTVVAVDAGGAFSVARCSDGTMAAWGAGSSGQLGNGGTTSSNAALTVNAGGLVTGERFAGAWCGDGHGLALVASPPPPAVETLAASGVGDAGATLSGTASGNGSNATVSFEYGPTTLYGTGIAGTPASVTGTAITPVTAVLTGLAPDTLYHYRVVAGGPGGLARGADLTFTTTDVAALKRLTLGGATLWPAFRSELTAYSAAVPAGTTSITVTPTSRSDTATVTLNGVTVPSGAASEAINLVPGNNALQVVVAEGGQTRTYTVTVTRLPEIYAFDTPASVPVTVGGMVATGQRVEFALNHAPAVGANLTVVSNTGVDFIQGGFDNLAQGQVVQLGFGGVVYPFVANYFGGTGNDLVLQWGSNRLLAWGSNGSGELGTISSSNSTVPVPVDSSGVLAGKTILNASLGSGHSLVWCADGALAAWGGRQSNVGDGSGSWPNVTLPVLVDRTGVFAGKTIAAIAASGNIRVAACADGTLAKWGSDGSANSYTRPLLVAADELVGRKVVAVAAGTDHALALCADGLLVAWGINTSGQLGNNSTTNTTEPVRVIRDGVLSGKTIIAIAAGTAHSYALCADGSVAAWGANDKGQLGDGTTVMRKFPVLVDRSGVLAGRTVVAVSAGGNSGLVRCADGKLAAWGDNASGQLGDGTTVSRTTPVLVNQSGVLAGKTVTAAFAGYSHSIVQCADGTVAAWGANASGQFGNATTTSSNVPVVGGLATLREGERLGACYGGGSHTLAVVAMPPPPLALTLAASGIKDRGATLNGSANAQGTASTIRFEYGLTTAYGTTVAVAGTATGTAATPASVTLGDLLAGSTYHYRVVAENPGGVARGADMTFTTSTFASLAGLSLSEGTLSPAFAGALTNYSATVPFATGSVTVTPVTAYPDAMATVNGASVASGAASAPVSLTLGNNALTVRVVSADGLNTTDYTINVVRLPETSTFAAATTVPLTVGALAAAGEVPPIVLGFAPVPGTPLTVVNNTGTQPIAGRFSNLAQGQVVVLSYGGVSYQFVANYYGGSGNDLVLHWANTRVVRWGSNTLVPTPVEMTGALAGKTVVLCGTGSHQMALAADGTLAGWGSNSYGQLGINSTTDQTSPVAVDRSGVLAGRNVIDLVVGNYHNLALCSDGTLVAWGYNNYGQLGINSTTTSLVPVAVNTAGVLAGRRITAIAAGDSHCLALCADGTLAAWGYNNNGQLGNNSTGNSLVPVAVDRSGVLAGKTVVAIAAGSSHSLALCADGALATWGYGSNGQLGNGSSTTSLVPVLVTQSGVLAAKTVKSIATGTNHNFALCTDGVLVCWGGNAQGALGNGGSSNAYTPVVVTQSGVLASKTISAAFGKSIHSLALCTDGSMAAWGYNGGGQLGNNSTTTTALPVLVSTTGLRAGERFIAVGAGVSSSASLAITASPPPPLATTTAAGAVKDDAATLTANVEPNGSSTAVTFEYGPTTGYGTTVTATPSPVTGTGVKAVSYVLGGLPAGATYHYRVIAESPGGTARGADMTFTTSTLATLAGLTTSNGAVMPAFEMNRPGYFATVAFAVEAITVTPTLTEAASSVKVNGVVVASGSASAPVAVAAGNTTIPVVVTSADGNNTRTYQLTVNRLPAAFAWPVPSSVPVTAADFVAVGNAPPLVLGHAVQTGASLMVVNNTGAGPIRGAFGNLADGQRVALEYGGISYPFFVNYAGGTGNDLVLEWGNCRLMSWGSNSQGQLGDGTLTDVKIPTAVPWSGELAGRVVRDARAGFQHSLGLTWDGSLVVWGNTNWGTSGSGSPTFPKVVPNSGALVGKTVVAIAVGERHNLALCADGTLAAWGYNYRGQLGDNGTATLDTPVLVDRTGALAGKEIVGLEAGDSFSAALCADGTVVEWGWLSGGQSGPEVSRVPVSMQGRGALVGKKVVKLRGGFSNWLALCSDGTLVVWGANGAGQFGNGTTGFTDDRYAPAAVSMTGVLAGKTIQEMAVGSSTCLVLCSDGTLVSWGSNYYGQLGIGTKTNSPVPVQVNQTGVLAGKTVVKVFAGQSQCYALCRDGSMAAWGYNYYASLGTGTTTESTVPALVSDARFAAGEAFAWSGGPGSAYNHALALSAMPPAPAAATLAADPVSDQTATLRASVLPNGSATPVSFQYGRTSAYGFTVAAVPAAPGGGATTAVAAVLTNLEAGTTYHFRVVATGPGGTALGEDMTFSTSTLATLAGLTADVGSLQPDFTSLRTPYSLTVSSSTAALALTPVAAHAGASIKVNGVAVASGSASTPVPLATGNTVIPVVVTAADVSATRTYTVTVTRVPDSITFAAAGGAALTAEEFDGTGLAPTFTLGFAPVAGTLLRVVDQTGMRFLRGRFANLAQGQEVSLAYNGIVYRFVVDYFGGTGNDLVLRWASTRLLGAGSNDGGQLGDSTSTSRNLPTPVASTGVLAGKTVIAAATGSKHTLVLCADGTLAAWGDNSSGQLGTGDLVSSKVPVAVSMTGDLAGRRVVALGAGIAHSLVLCDDGAILGWGSNSSGQLGETGSDFNPSPVLLEDLGVLAGREVVAIAAGGYGNLALCADGTVAAWGGNSNGWLGDGATVASRRPVAVSRAGVLAEKRVVMIAAGNNHNLVLCADGTLVAWGANGYGQLGTGDQLACVGPVAVKPAGALAGKTVVEIAAGTEFSLVRCADNTLVSWGRNYYGQLGIGSTTDSVLPVAVSATGVLAGKTITHVAAGNRHSVTQSSDGTVAGWGYNASGPLGNGTTSTSTSAVAMNLASVAADERIVAAWTSCIASHTLAMVASPARAAAETLAATAVTDTGATLNGVVRPYGSAATVTFEYGLTETYGAVATALPSPVTAAESPVVAALSDLTPGNVYHFRVRAVNGGGTVTGVDRTFTTTQTAGLAGLTLDAGGLAPVFDSRTRDYLATVPHAAASVTLTPRAIESAAVIEVGGAVVASGTASPPIALAVGTTPVVVRVVSGDGISTQTYTLALTRLPETFAFQAADTVPVSATRFTTGGLPVAVSLGFAPAAGTELCLVDVTGSGVIDGRFANLAQGQTLALEYGGVFYPFVVDYFGGTGNDLVLHWANTRLLAWGANNSGQLGVGNTTDSLVPVAVVPLGALAGKVVTAVEFGGFPMQSAGGHRLALCSDGTVTAWGVGSNGQLGNNTFIASKLPVGVDRSGVLAGKRVVRVVAGVWHNLALCEDGTLVAWGNNASGELGDGTTTSSPVPVAVDQTGVLAGKTVIALEAGNGLSYVACADGTVVRWGGNRTRPVEMVRSGALAGKTVVEIAAASHCIARCSDGTLASWGGNNYGQLGDGTTIDRSDPVAVVATGVLAGKSVVQIAAGDLTSMALCSDGTVAVWGWNQYGGGMGTGGSTYYQSQPNAVDRSGLLAGRTVTQIATSGPNFFALCSDGFAATWGNGSYGMLGIGSTSGADTPAALDVSLVQAGERVVRGVTGLAMVASPPAASAETLTVTVTSDTSAILRGRVLPNGGTLALAFDYGLTETYGWKLAATPATASGTAAVEVAATLSGLLPGTTYHFRMAAAGAGGTATGDDLSFTTTARSTLAGLAVDGAALHPAFSPLNAGYSVTVGGTTDRVLVRPVLADPAAAVTVNGLPLPADGAAPVALQPGSNNIDVVVTASDGVHAMTYRLVVTRLPAVFAFGEADDVPASAEGFDASGRTAAFELGFEPPPGTLLTVLDNTGGDLIYGEFANLPQGGIVILEHGGTAYRFVADYFGGTGNDLVLRWADTRLLGWGSNTEGVLGNGVPSKTLVPVAIESAGALAGKTILDLVPGANHCLAVCADGTMATWGTNSNGSLGSDAFTWSAVTGMPGTVERRGALAGRRVAVAAVGSTHNLVLCTDGTLVAWGGNDYGQLGDGTKTSRTVPVAVDQTGVLAGKRVVAIAAGGSHNLALCADGTLAAWGVNASGNLGINNTATSSQPVAVDRSGVLKDKTVVAIAAGGSHSMALCSDGTLATWGSNTYGQIGDDSTTNRLLPVRVDQNGVLAGKRVTAVWAGNVHCLAKCEDGTIAAWGRNFAGTMGNGTKTDPTKLPVAVDLTGILAGKTITSLVAGNETCLALCADGFAAAWGYNYYGQLGVNSTIEGIAVPTAIKTSALRVGERYVALRAGRGGHASFALAATPPLPVARTLVADGIGDAGATIHGTVNANDHENVEVFFEYGLTDAYGGVAVATPASVGIGSVAAVSASLTGLQPAAIYHFRCVARAAAGTVRGEDLTFTTGSGAALAGLSSSVGTLAPAFTPALADYRLTVAQGMTQTLTLTPVLATAGATVTVAGSAVASGAASAPMPLGAGNHTIEVLVGSPSGETAQMYRVRVTVVPAVMRFASPDEVAVQAAGFDGTGIEARFELGFAPVPGTRLLVVDNLGAGWIAGAFSNLTHGQAVELAYAGKTYHFLANYHGGTGNDLTLEWAGTRVVGWGSNYGVIGNGQTTQSSVPVPTYREGVLQGKTVFSVTVGASHALVLCSDGTLAAWGNNGYGEVGNGTTTRITTPAAVDVSGVLAGKTVVAVAAGASHCLALCSDGSLAGWGSNQIGQLGGNIISGRVPEWVDTTGVLAGKTITTITAGGDTSYALCADGTLAAWGENAAGAMGNNSLAQAMRPVLVDRSGVLAGKTLVTLAAGGSHVLALCADGTLAAWGDNQYGQLGDGTITSAKVPVLVNHAGVLAGKTIIAMAAGKTHSLVLCADGTLAAWGSNDNGQLGNGSATGTSALPVAVQVAGAWVGRKVVAVEAGTSYSLARCDDGSALAWGDNAYGQLGNGTTTDSALPVAVSTASLLAGERFLTVVTGSRALTNLALTAMAQAPQVTTLAASAVGATSATLHGVVAPDGAAVTEVAFEHGPTTAYGRRIAADPASVDGSEAVAVQAVLGNLPPGTSWHYRLRAAGPAGTLVGDDFTFSTGANAILADLALGGTSLYPAFDGRTTEYAATVPFDRAVLGVAPRPVDPLATVTVNGGPLASGDTAVSIPLVVGDNRLTVGVTAAGGGETVVYTVNVVRLPEVLEFGSAGDTPVISNNFTCGGVPAVLGLRFAPPVGTSLTLVRNDGGDFIAGSFVNFAHGQTVGIEYNGTVYQFVANWFGGDGNDLVLEWANTHWIGWGYNLDSAYGGGALAIGSVGSEPRPVLAANTGVLVGRRILKVAAGGAHSLFLCADGMLAAAGDNGNGQLGINTTTDSTIGVAVDRSGVLAGKTVATIAAGSYYSLALCADGTVAGWGTNIYGQLGDGTTTGRQVPVAVNGNGALAGRKVVAIAAGEDYAGAVCADGTVVAWGHGWGLLPQRIDTTALAGHGRITALRPSRPNFLALCQDGSVFSWGASGVPAPVVATAFAGRKVVAIAAGYGTSYALCDDGAVFAWGTNTEGQLGIGTLIDSPVPVAVTRTGPLADGTVVAVGSGASQGMALCADGRVAAWGWNHGGQIGDATQVSPRTTAVAVDLGILVPGERVITPPNSPCTGSMFAQVAAPLPEVATLPALNITKFTAKVRGNVLARGSETRIWFEYGTTTTYGMSAAGNPAQVHWKLTTAATAATLAGLVPGTTYHYRVVAASDSGIVRGADLTFTTISDNALLADLGHDGGVIAPGFEKHGFEYWSSVPFTTTAVTVSAVTDHPRATFTVNGGGADYPVSLDFGNNIIVIDVTAEDRETVKTYTINVYRLPQAFVFNRADDIPVTADGFAAGGNPVSVVLNHAPVPGTILTMVNNTGLGFIHGNFGNLAHGQRIKLAFDGRTYDFVANYYGGSGNDLVLQWADTQLMAWGSNSYGQLGDNSTTRRLRPGAIDDTGVLANKTLTAVAEGYLHSLALCSDGALAAWGYNVHGELGNNSAAPSSVPVAVDRSGALAGKTVVAIAAGPFHNLALCADGAVAAWGYNNYGQLGTGDTATRRVPVLVNPAGALAGKHVVAVAAGAYHSFALCDDGTLAAWGYNDEGELGDGTTTNSLVPVAVDLPAGKRIASIAAGQYHTLALCTDGTLLAWGYNNRGQLGNDSILSSKMPVAIGGFGALAGKPVLSVRASGAHSMALCADGTLAAWGWNKSGQLGLTGVTQSTVPVAIDLSGVAAGQGLTQIALGGNHSLARFADGTLAAWGDNANGQLGNGSTTPSTLPVAVDPTGLVAGARFMAVASGSAALHTLAVVALPVVGIAPSAAWLQQAALVDSDQDGSYDLIEYAFGLHLAPAAQLPQAQRIGNDLVLRFTQPAGVTGITYGAESSATLLPESWTEVPDSGTGETHIFRVPVGAEEKWFLRLKVTGR